MIAGAVPGLEPVGLDDVCCAVVDETRLVLGSADKDKLEGLDVVVCSVLLDKELLQEELLEKRLLDEDGLVVVISAEDGGIVEMGSVCSAVEDKTRLFIGSAVEDKLGGIEIVVCSVLLDVDVDSIL